jgi:high-affinity iron transporter
MLQITVIIFREVLEMSLIVSILFAATSGIKNRNAAILYGILTGIIGSIILALFTSKITNSFHGMGQEIASAIILFSAAIMIGYTVIWIKNHAKDLSKNIKALSKKVINGEKTIYTLFIIVALSILREGAEIVLFSYSYLISGSSSLELMLGGSLGLVLGIIVGLMFYFGLIKSLGKYFFSVTTTILIFLSAGLVASSLGYLIKANVIPAIIYQVWDSSFLISDKGVVGTILHVLTGYISRPSAIQLIGYFLTLIILFTLTKSSSKKTKKLK